MGLCFAAFPVGGRRGDPPLPALRHRRRHQPHARLRRADGRCWPRPTASPRCCSGPLLGRGSAWTTAGATLAVAVAFRPLRARVQDAVDRRFNRARYDALRRIAGFLEDLRAGRAAPEAIEAAAARAALATRGSSCASSCPRASSTSTRAACRSPTRRTTGASGRRSSAAARRSAWSSTTRRARSTRPAAAVVEAGGLAIEIARLRVELRRQLAEVEASRARIVAAGYEERRRIERDLHDGAQQRLVSIGLALRHAQHELGARAPERASQTLDGAVAELARGDRRAARARARPAARPARRRAGARRCASSPAARRCRSRSRPPASGFAAASRRPPTSSPARGSPTPSSTREASQVVLSAARDNGTLVVSRRRRRRRRRAPRDGSGLSGLADRVAAHGGTLRIESDRAPARR